jgi:hypothetical protein
MCVEVCFHDLCRGVVTCIEVCCVAVCRGVLACVLR